MTPFRQPKEPYDRGRERRKRKQTQLIQLYSAELSAEIVQEILTGFAEGAPGFGEDDCIYCRLG